MRLRTGRRLADDVESGDRRAALAWAGVSVVRMRMAVVLPAPLWPSRPSTVPGATSRSRSRSAQRSSNRLPSPVAVTTAGRRGCVVHDRLQVFVWCTDLFVHSTTKNSSTLYDVASEYPTEAGPEAGRPATRAASSSSSNGDRASTSSLRAAEKITSKAAKQAAKVAAKTAQHLDSLDRLAAASGSARRVDADRAGQRKPRFTRDDIAAAAIRIADTEGLRGGVDAAHRRRARRRAR